MHTTNYLKVLALFQLCLHGRLVLGQPALQPLHRVVPAKPHLLARQPNQVLIVGHQEHAALWKGGGVAMCTIEKQTVYIYIGQQSTDCPTCLLALLIVMFMQDEGKLYLPVAISSFHCRTPLVTPGIT